MRPARRTHRCIAMRRRVDTPGGCGIRATFCAVRKADITKNHSTAMRDATTHGQNQLDSESVAKDPQLCGAGEAHSSPSKRL